MGLNNKNLLISDKWTDFELLATGDGEKLERWGKYYLCRPDPQIVWPKLGKDKNLWARMDAHYIRSSKGGGHWEYSSKIPNQWEISFQNLRFIIQPTGFKHTGLFPEQAENWTWMIDKISNCERPIKVLNLFAYTGGATVACASAGASVCHVDASKGMVNWAKENIEKSGLADRPVRFIVDDVFKFVQREIRRNNKYDAIIMDPPSYGRGPNGEVWKIEDSISSFIVECTKILSDNPLFFIINSYTTGFSPIVLKNLLQLSVDEHFNGKTSCGELAIPVSNSGIFLPCGIYGKWEG
jgi:23S rRNA (cytosine1962-C5)-methyltransferase